MAKKWDEKMTIKVDEKLLIDQIKGYFQDHEMPPIYLEEGDVFNFSFEIHCKGGGVIFFLEELEIPEE